MEPTRYIVDRKTYDHLREVWAPCGCGRVGKHLHCASCGDAMLSINLPADFGGALCVRCA